MTLKLTERDKKLLIVLAVVAVVAGLGGQVILPLLDKNSQLRQELDAARLEKSEREIKVNGLAGMQAAEENAYAAVGEMSKSYYGQILSKEVDRMLTTTVTTAGAIVVDLDIQMPGEEEETSLMDYSVVETLSGGEQGLRTFSGFSTVNVSMNLAGKQDTLQKILDGWMHAEPGIRVEQFQWQTSREGERGLSLTLEIYRMQDVEEYIQSRMEENQTTPDGEQNDQEESPEDLVNDVQ